MTFNQFLRIIEIRTKIVSVSTLLLAHLYILRVTGRIDMLMLALVVTAALLVDMGTTAFNSYFDYVRKVDNSSIKRESEKVLVHEGVPPAYAFFTGAVMFAAAVGLGLVIIYKAGWPVLLLGGLSLTAGFLYSGGPLPISRTPFGEIFAGGFLGTILFMVVLAAQWAAQAAAQGAGPGTAQVTAQVTAWEAVLPGITASLPGLIHIAAILTVNNTCDIIGDKAAGRRTLSILAGVRISRVVIAIELAAAYAAIFITIPFILCRVWVILPGILLSFLAFKSMVKYGFSHETKASSMGKISASFIAFTVTYALLLFPWQTFFN